MLAAGSRPWVLASVRRGGAARRRCRDKKERLAQFSFLMVIPPILGEALLDVKDIAEMGVSQAMAGLPTISLVVGFLAAFVCGCLACNWMINIVKKGKLIWFAIYCAVVGTLTIVLPLL